MSRDAIVSPLDQALSSGKKPVLKRLPAGWGSGWQRCLHKVPVRSSPCFSGTKKTCFRALQNWIWQELRDSA